jgi:hypothetical protein
MIDHDDSSVNERSKALIDRLATNLKPVRVKSLRFLAIQYFVTLSVLGGIFLGVLGVGQNEYLASLILFTLNVSVGSFLLAQYSRPGVTLSRGGRLLFLSTLGLASLTQIFRFCFGAQTTSWGPPIEHGWACFATALVMGGLASALLVFEVRREAPIKPSSAALFLLVSSGAMAALVLQIHCPNENPIHQILWHIVLPGAIFVVSARRVSRIFLRW